MTQLKETPFERATRQMVGTRYGKLVVTDVFERGAKNNLYAKCLCDCGKEFDIGVAAIRNKGKTRCNSCPSETDTGTLVGTRVGMLVVTRHYLSENSYGKVTELVRCTCDCGGVFGYTILPVEKFGVGENDRCMGCIHSRRTSAGLQKVSIEEWKGYKISDTHRERNDPRLRDWRCSVLRRDKHTCQCCESKNDLEAHHIQNFSKKKRLRHKVDNGITLCKSCHCMYVEGSFHMEYGTVNNNEGQLDEYIRKKREALGLPRKEFWWDV